MRPHLYRLLLPLEAVLPVLESRDVFLLVGHDLRKLSLLLFLPPVDYHITPVVHYGHHQHLRD